MSESLTRLALDEELTQLHRECRRVRTHQRRRERLGVKTEDCALIDLTLDELGGLHPEERIRIRALPTGSPHVYVQYQDGKIVK